MTPRARDNNNNTPMRAPPAAAGDDGNEIPPEPAEEADAALVVANGQQQDGNNEWEETGYTPFGDGAVGGGMMMYAAMPSTDDGDGETFTFTTPSEGVFFADMNAFAAASNNDDDEDEGNSEQEETEQGETDFRAIANQALKALDEEYSMALRGINNVTAKDETTKSQATTTGQSQHQEALQQQQDYDDEPIRFEEGDFNPSNPPPVASLPSSASIIIEPKIEPEIDINAVQRAIQSIQLKNTSLQQKMQQRELMLPPRQHEIIPTAPLSAFRKTSSTKAQQATANLSRSSTVANALSRLKILSNNNKSNKASSSTLVVDILGVDHVETKSVEQIRRTFGPLIRWLGASAVSPEAIHLQLIGPNVIMQPGVNLLPTNLSKRSPLKVATATCHVGTYHEVQASTTKSDLAIAFNAGMWGYDDWKPTLEALSEVTLITTSYTMEEAQDDLQVLEQYCKEIVWKPEPNPFSCTIKQSRASMPGREYRDNAIWQACTF